MLDFYIPHWLYERLPYLYVAVGIFTLANLEHRIGVLSGGLLILIGVYIWFMRRTSRSELSQPTRQKRAFRSSDRRR